MRQNSLLKNIISMKNFDKTNKKILLIYVKTKNKICLITGGTGLIGQAIWMNFSVKELLLSLHLISTLTKQKNYVLIKNAYFLIKMNIKQKSSIKTALNYIEKRFKKLDVIVNNAGINKPTDFDKIKEKDWDEILEVNLKGLFMIMQESIRLIKKSTSGSIINVSSVSGQYGGPRTYIMQLVKQV